MTDKKLNTSFLVEDINHLKLKLKWSNTKIANIIHAPSKTIKQWLASSDEGFSLKINSYINIMYLVVIHKNLESMFTNPQHQKLWLSTLHPELKVIPEQQMTTENGLINIFNYLNQRPTI